MRMIICNLLTLAIVLPFVTNMKAPNIHHEHKRIGKYLQSSRQFFPMYSPDGILATRGEFPFTAILGWPILYGSTGDVFTYRSFCGGSIITKFHILTSAQCFSFYHKKGYKENTMVAVLGAFDRRYRMPEELRIPVLRIDPHPFYMGHPDFLNDIALVTLSTGIRYGDGVKPICLPHPTSIAANKTVTQIGYQNPEIAANAFLPRKLVTLALSVPSCQQYWRVTTGQLCTYSQTAAFCREESGGPVVAIKDGFFVLVGVQSVISCDKNKPIVNTAVPGYIKWISKVINATKPEALSDLCIK
uniref:Trypsin n=1 Tax=Lygus lineolaris TaxID=50650 RepID=A0A184WFU5_LYGLI|nr:trypsin precursor [Lygus lineolaris]